MDNQETIQWVLGALSWCFALAVLGFNIRRQFTNQAYVDAGSDKRVSGIPMLFSIFTWVGVGFSPLVFNGFWYLCLVFEIPAFFGFITEAGPSADDTVGENDDENKA